MKKSDKITTFEIPIIPHYYDEADDCIELAPEPGLVKYVTEKFNEDELALFQHDTKAKTIVAHAKGNRVFVSAEFDKPVTPRMRRKIIEFVDGQCSDGWGEGFEQQGINGYQFGYDHSEIYVSTWRRGWREKQETK